MLVLGAVNPTHCRLMLSVTGAVDWMIGGSIGRTTATGLKNTSVAVWASAGQGCTLPTLSVARSSEAPYREVFGTRHQVGSHLRAFQQELPRIVVDLKLHIVVGNPGTTVGSIPDHSEARTDRELWQWIHGSVWWLRVDGRAGLRSSPGADVAGPVGRGGRGTRQTLHWEHSP